jgi:hypothetical protein
VEVPEGVSEVSMWGQERGQAWAQSVPSWVALINGSQGGIEVSSHN